MDSQVSRPKKRMTEEEFRSCYPDVSIQHLTEKASPRGLVTVEKHVQVKTPMKTAQISKSPVAKSQVSRLQPIKIPQNSVEKTSLPATKITTPNIGKTFVQTKLTPMVKSPVTPKTNTNVTKSLVTNSPAVIKTPVTNKTPVAAKNLFTPNKTVAPGVVVKTTPTPTKVSTSILKTPKLPIVKTPQNVVKQQTANVVKQQTPNVVKSSVSTPTTKEDVPDQSTMVLTCHLSQTVPQRPSKQLTIEKIDQQRIPVLDSSNQVVLQQVINNGQLVLQNRVTPVETTVQSVVIGTTAQAAVTPLPQVEITTSEPLQALQVTQQVTLFGPKGNKFTVDDVKKQINLNNKQNAMTNVVSSTTNSIPAPVPVPTQSVQQEQKKVVQPVNSRTQIVKSQVRQSRVTVQQRGQVLAQQYNSTRGQTKNVSPKREIPMQKVSPMQPPPPPPLQMLVTDQLGNEEEVTTSDDTPQPKNTKILVVLPSGENKEIMITDDLSLNLTLQDLLTKHNINIPLHMQNSVGAEILPQSETEDYQLTERSEEEHWENTDTIGPEPGEILGLQDEVGTGDRESTKTKIPQEDELQKEVVNTEPVFQKGLLAVCGFCGMSSNNFSRCPRCTRPIPPDCKTISSESLQVRTSEKSKQLHSENQIPKFGLDELLWKSRKTKADSLTAESPKKKRTCKRKRLDEPVCLTISDDEELLGLAHHTLDSVHSDSNSQLSSCDKEPVITDDMVSELKYSVSGGGLDSEELLDNASPSERTYLQCRTVRIGSYKVVPKDRVLITPYGLKVTVPVLSSDQYVELKIMYHEIIKVLMHFGRQMPVLFFYTRPTAAAKIRKALRMEDKNGYYYDTTSSDETHRRITFLPDKIDDECKSNLKNIFGNPENNIFAELTGKEANDILVKASPKEVQAFILKKQPDNNQPQPFDGQNIQTIMVYPPPPEKGGIPINTEDYACLGEDQFLNDVIIDFYLKYVVEKTLSPEDRARTHVFSSFFYKRLTTKPPAKRRSMNPVENDPAASPAAKRHSRVKSWTKNVNLFNKDFIVIPINENSHWFLAIVCFPGLTGPVRFSDNIPIELPGRKKKVDVRSVTIGSTTITSPNAPMVDVGDDVEDRDEADGEDEDMDVPDCEEEPVSKSIIPEVKEEEEEEQQCTRKKQQREPIKQPCILIFDSLAGASRSRVVATLRDYLRVEYEAKHGETRDFSGDIMKGSNVKCPQQTNYTDCGLYVLQYVEAFFQWPVTDYRIPIKQLQDWFQADIVSRKRYEIQQLLHRLMLEQSINIEALNLPLLNLRPEGKLVEDYSGTEEEEEDEDDENICDEDEDMLDDDGDYHDDMVEGEEMEEGEIDDPENFPYHNMHDDDEDHEMDDEMEYCMDEDEDEPPEDEEEELVDKELDDLSLSHLKPFKGDNLKNYRIPRLATKNNVKTDNTFKDDQLN